MWVFFKSRLITTGTIFTFEVMLCHDPPTQMYIVITVYSTKQAFASSKSATETVENGVRYFQGYQNIVTDIVLIFLLLTILVYLLLTLKR